MNVVKKQVNEWMSKCRAKRMIGNEKEVKSYNRESLATRGNNLVTGLTLSINRFFSLGCFPMHVLFLHSHPWSLRSTVNLSHSFAYRSFVSRSQLHSCGSFLIILYSSSTPPLSRWMKTRMKWMSESREWVNEWEWYERLEMSWGANAGSKWESQGRDNHRWMNECW